MESYDGQFMVDSLKTFIGEREDGIFDGFEVIFPDGMNTIDPLLAVQYGTVEATFEEQLLLTKSLIVGKHVKFKLFEEDIGDFQLSDVKHGFLGFPVFEQYPIALQILIKLCYVTVLKNSVPPLSASQRAVMERRKAQRLAALASSQGDKSKQPE